MNKKSCLAIMAAAVLLSALSCAPVDNYPPIITSLEGSADWTFPLGSLNVTCTASDRDGDELSYNWSASGGNITGTGPKVTWTAPEEIGVCDITVVVNDGHDEEDTRSVILIAANGTIPMIENLVVTAEHKYLKKTTTGYKVGKGKEYDIECIASSNTSGELVYDWSYDGGEISGEGSMITWTAPYTAGVVTVTAIVFDVAGNMDSESIVFTVVSCTSCEFG
jgi:hypothetical protein